MKTPSVFQTSGFRRLFLGQGISSLGDWMATVAFMAIAADISGSPTAVGGILVLRLLPGAIAGPLSGRVAHRLGYRRSMLAMDAARAVMIAIVPLVYALWWVYIWAFMIEVASLLFLPARDSSIPMLVKKQDIPVANSFVLGSSYGTIPFGAGAFALFLAFPFFHFSFIAAGKYTPVFWADALSFLASFEAIRRIDELRGKMPELRPGEVDSPAFHEAFRIPLIRAVMPSTAAVALGLGALFSLGIVFVQSVLDASKTEFGVLIALFGVGAVGGLGLVQLRHENGLADMRFGAAIAGSMIVLTSLAPTITIAFIGAAGFGTGVAYALTSGMTYLQERLEGEERVLTFATFHIVIRAGLGLGAIAAGVAADALDRVNWPIVGSLSSARVVLLCAGLLVLVSIGAAREPAGAPVHAT